MPIISHSRPFIGKEEITAVTALLKTGFIAQGSQADALEKEVSKTVGLKYGIAVASGTASLHLALLALGVKKNDTVIIPSFVCTALLNAVCMTGASALFADINSESGHINAKSVKSVIQKNTKAIIVPHLFGQPAEIDKICKLGIPVIEDCAQCVGATLKRNKIGSFGLMSVFSFYATKLISSGEGGMVCTSNREIADKIRDLRDYDNRSDYKIRYNYKLSDIHASIAVCQLKKLNKMVSRRREIANYYLREFKNLPVCLPYPIPNTHPVYFRFVIRVKPEVKTIINKMKKVGIQCARPIFKPLHYYFNRKYFLPKTDEFYRSAISIPIYPALTEKEMKSVADNFIKVITDICC
jgi:perosamine synthetase